MSATPESKKPLVDSASDAEQVQQAEIKQRSRQQKESADVVAVMSTAEGRRFVKRILDAAGVYQTSFVRGESDATAFNEGRRNVGLLILAAIDSADPQSYDLMMQESRKERG